MRGRVNGRERKTDLFRCRRPRLPVGSWLLATLVLPPALLVLVILLLREVLQVG